MLDKKIQPLVMGQYTVAKRDKAQTSEDVFIATPAVQSCIAVVLISNHAVGLGHFDSIYDLENALNDMINTMRRLGNSEIKAELIGGNYGITPQSSWLFSENICGLLNKEKILFEYKHYSSHYAGISTVGLYLASNLLGVVGPESMLYSIPLSIVLFVAASTTESWMRFDFYDVTVNVKTGDITTSKNNLQKSKEIIQKFSTYQSGFFDHRMKQGVFDKNLKYEKITFHSNEPGQQKHI